MTRPLFSRSWQSSLVFGYLAAFSLTLAFCLTPLERALGQTLPLEQSQDKAIVIVLSWDGMRYDYPEEGHFPGLRRLEREGVRGTLIPVYPSNTFPGHVSLSTGAYPDRHGILDNHFFDRKRGRYRYERDANWIEVEPLWIAAERQGVRAATYFWAGSESDWRGQGISYRMAPFDSGRPEKRKVRKILEWLQLPEERRPRLIMSYWRGPDSIGHKKGTDHPDIAARIRQQDEQLRDLLEGIDALKLWPLTTILLVSDHGMTEVEEFIDIGARLKSASIPTNMAGGASVRHLFFNNPDDLARAELALRAIPGLQVFRRENLDPALRISHPSRTGDLVVMVDPPLALGKVSLAEKALRGVLSTTSGWSTGAHGFDPKLPDMWGVFYAMGRGVRKNGKLVSIFQVDVAPTVARLLGIDPPRGAEGQARALEALPLRGGQ